MTNKYTIGCALLALAEASGGMDTKTLKQHLFELELSDPELLLFKRILRKLYERDLAHAEAIQDSLRAPRRLPEALAAKLTRGLERQPPNAANEGGFSDES